MSDLISREELAEQLNVSASRVEVATREDEWVRRQYPVADWAVCDEEGNIQGYEVPEVAQRKLGLTSSGSAGEESSWWRRLIGFKRKAPR